MLRRTSTPMQSKMPFERYYPLLERILIDQACRTLLDAWQRCTWRCSRASAKILLVTCT